MRAVMVTLLISRSTALATRLDTARLRGKMKHD